MRQWKSGPPAAGRPHTPRVFVGLQGSALARRGLEQELARSKGDPVAVFEGMLPCQLPVDECAVSGTEVDQQPSTRVAPQLRVPAAYVRIGQDHVAARETTDHHGL